MDPSQVYAIALSSLLALWVLLRMMARVYQFFKVVIVMLLLKHLVYPIFYRRRRWIGTATRHQALSLLVYITINVACLLAGGQSVRQVGSRAGMMSTINLLGLVVGPHLSLVATYLGASLGTHIYVHRWIGRMTMIHTIVHVILSSTTGLVTLQDTPDLSGVVVSTSPLHILSDQLQKAASSLALLFLLSFKFLRMPFYEFFLKNHLILTVVASIGLWQHLLLRKTMAQIYLKIGSGIFVTFLAVHVLGLAFRNIFFGSPCPRAEINDLQGAVHVTVTTARPWKIKAGQYVYLWIPGMSFWSFFQSHPFMIAWWESNGAKTTITLLITPEAGFTSFLPRSSNSVFRAGIDGPYGVPTNFGDHGTVLMFATNIGIATQIPYIKALMEGYNSFEVKTRKIHLVWQLDRECKTNLLFGIKHAHKIRPPRMGCRLDGRSA